MGHKVNKRYVAINRQSLILMVDIPGTPKRVVTVQFMNGYGLRAEGYKLTDDPALQKALEEDKRFNKSYRLDEIDGVPIAEVEARKEIAEKEARAAKKAAKKVPMKEEAEETKPEVAEEVAKEEIKEVPLPSSSEEETPVTKSFKNSQDAKDWLNKEHKVPFSQMRNKPALLAKAKELDIQLVFKSK